jgi:hypothetical protein
MGKPALPPGAPYNENWGLPGLLLQQPVENDDADEIFGDMWIEFRDAVVKADRIVVLGHSLHDAELAETLRGQEAKTLYLGWTDRQANWGRVVDGLRQRLPLSRAARLQFGPEFSIPDKTVQVIDRWKSGQ